MLCLLHCRDCFIYLSALPGKCSVMLFSALKEWCFYLAGHSVNVTVRRHKDDSDEVWISDPLLSTLLLGKHLLLFNLRRITSLRAQYIQFLVQFWDIDFSSAKEPLRVVCNLVPSQPLHLWVWMSNDIISSISTLHAQKYLNKLNFNWTFLILTCFSALPTEAQWDVECC